MSLVHHSCMGEKHLEPKKNYKNEKTMSERIKNAEANLKRRLSK